MDRNFLDVEIAKSVGAYFRLAEKEMNTIIAQVKSSVATWQEIASEIGISRNEQILMSGAFRL